MKRLLLAFALVAVCRAVALGADDPATDERQANDEAAIRKTVDAYVAAYNAGDARALAALWSPDAVYVIPQEDSEVEGRAAIEAQFAGIFANAKGAKLEAATESIQFVSPNVAIEQGTATLVQPEQPADRSSYTAVYTKRDGQWLLDRVTEREASAEAAAGSPLEELDWMVGTWEDKDQQSKVETTCQWTKNRRFMVRSFAVQVGDTVDVAGMQIVGWDPSTKQIRSWVFDSDGGFAEGVWKKRGNAWHILTKGTLPNGGKASAMNILTPVNENAFTWQSVDRESDGEILPNVDEVLVVRSGEEQTAARASVPVQPAPSPEE